MIEKQSKIYIAGHRGMVGSAIFHQLESQGFSNIITRTHADLDLCNQEAVHNFMELEQPDYVVLVAAKVGGIFANNEFPADFIYQNLAIESNVIHQAYLSGCKQLLFLGSSCIYPKLAEQPMTESALLTGFLEPTNEPYAVTKIAGIKLCESYNRQYGTDYRSVMPTNLYGPGDNFHPKNSHVIPALLRRSHAAKLEKKPKVEAWGTGKAMREFLFADNMAAACFHVMSLPPVVYQQHTQPMLSHINVGTGKDVTIKELVDTVVKVTGYQGSVVWNTEMPDGTPRKLMDVSRLASLGWTYDVELEAGLKVSYQWFLDNQDQFRS